MDSKKIGRNYESRVVKFFRTRGYQQARRVPLSGALPHPDLKHDVHVDDFKPFPLEIECKKTSSVSSIRLFFDNVDRIGFQNRGSFLLLVFSLLRTKNFVILPLSSELVFYQALQAITLPVKKIGHKEKSIVFKRKQLDLVGWNAATGRLNCLEFQSYTGKYYIVVDLDWGVKFLEKISKDP
ncbi:MAG: putative PDDEXK endonuclease [Candidatus Hodarchaeales archaeon]|jgi:Holliday junction resolvase